MWVSACSWLSQVLPVCLLVGLGCIHFVSSDSMILLLVCFLLVGTALECGLPWQCCRRVRCEQEAVGCKVLVHCSLGGLFTPQLLTD